MGLQTWHGVYRFRNIKVTAPDGTILWQGPPHVTSLGQDRPFVTQEPEKPPVEEAKVKEVAVVDVARPKAPASQGPLEEIARLIFEPMGFAFSPDGKKLAFTRWYVQLIVYDLVTGKEILNRPRGAKPVVGDQAHLSELVIGSRGEYVLAHSDQMIRVRDEAGDQVLRTFEPSPLGQFFRFLRYSKQGNWVVGRGPTQVGIWDLATGKQLRRYDFRLMDLDVHPNGKHLVTLSDDRMIGVVDAKTGSPIAGYPDVTKKVQRVRFTPDGNQIACWGGGQPGFFLIDPATGALVQAFQGHAAAVTDVAFFPNNRWVLSSSVDRTIKVWDRLTGAVLFEKSYADDVRRVGVAPDGRSVTVVIDKETFIYRWHNPPTATSKRKRQ